MESITKNEQRGVSMSKNDVRNADQKIDKGLFPKAFCKIVPDVFGDFARPLFSKPTVNVMHTDGAGTKSVLAYLYWKETGDLSVWKNIAQDAVVMNVDDLLCSGITNNILISSTIGRNRFRIPNEVVNAIILGTEEYLEEMRSQNISIHFGGGQTADIGDLVQTITVDSTVAARIRQNEIIANDRIQDEDVIIGLASYGQATYEKTYNSGIGSTDFTAARHDVLSKYYAEKYPESYDRQIANELAYTGSKKLTDASPVAGFNVGQLLLSPSRTYLPVMKAILENFRPSIHGLVHCSDGGQTKCLNFVNDLRVVKDNLFAVSPVFSMIQNESNTSWEEMYKVFNMGHRFEIFTKEKIAKDIIKIAQHFNIDAQIIGYCESAPTKGLTIKSTHGTFQY
ncbi:MAG: phosphoribosylformylglycinamidine cyclo-ligase [Bacteroidales bacterium]|jgi:phosphoribosylformylglycinamidine cyclo-ligase|nr:phosphoribosylformylglycinamidine cyclo-ligase [Bacteroidales bacterium]